MKPELRRDIQDYGVLIVFIFFMLVGMFKCTQHVDKIAIKYNTNQAHEFAVQKAKYLKNKSK